MYDGLNSPSIHMPENLSEYSQTVLRYPNAVIWAGGTNIMTREKAYPSRETNIEVVSLAKIEELKKVSRNDRMIELGATVTLDQIVDGNRNIIPKNLKDAILSVGSPLISDRATLGGAIAAYPLTSIPGTLVALGATSELKYVRRKSVKSRWTPVSLLFNESRTGRIALPQQGLITRVRIALQPNDFSYFKASGSYVDEPEDTIFVAFSGEVNQEQVQSPHFSVTFPTHGIVYSKDLDNIFMQLHFPLSGSEFSQLKNIVYTFVNSVTPKISRIQKVRLDSVLEDLISQINARTLVLSSIT